MSILCYPNPSCCRYYMYVDVRSSKIKINAEIQSILNMNTIKFSNIWFYLAFEAFSSHLLILILQLDTVLFCGLKVDLIISILKSVRLSIFNGPLLHCSHGNHSRKLNSHVLVYMTTSTLLLPDCALYICTWLQPLSV